MAYKFQAIHDFFPETSGEIELRKGDVLVMNTSPPDSLNEWWNGQNLRTQAIGYFPGNHVQLLQQTPGAPRPPPRPPREPTAGELSDLSSPAATPATAVTAAIVAVDEMSLGALADQVWYWGQASRSEINDRMENQPDGSFLVRDAISSSSQYTLTLRKGGGNKLIRIMYAAGKYGFSQPLEYNSVPHLIQYFRFNSLSQYNSGLDICLLHPLARSSPKGEGEIANLRVIYNETSDKFESLNAQFEEQATRRNTCLEKIETIKRLMVAQQDIVEWLHLQSSLLNDRANQTSNETRPIITEQMISVNDRHKSEKKVLDDLEIKQKVSQSQIREIENTLKPLKNELNEVSKSMQNLERVLRSQGLNPEDVQAERPQPVPAIDTTTLDEFPMEFYLQNGYDREQYKKVLQNKPDGTFLIRKSFHNPGSYTLDIVVNNVIRKVSIRHENGRFGLVEPTSFYTLTLLVDHYRRTSLREHNPELDTYLKYPAFHPNFQ